MFYKLCRTDCVSFLEQIGGAHEGVMRASQLSEYQQDAKKGSKRSEQIDIPTSDINQNLQNIPFKFLQQGSMQRVEMVLNLLGTVNIVEQFVIITDRFTPLRGRQTAQLLRGDMLE